MDKSKYETLFNQIIKKKHGMEIDFEKIEAKLGHLREGDALIYSDLEIIYFCQQSIKNMGFILF